MTEAKKRILLVEDEPNLAFNIEFNLQSEGYEVVLASDGKEALECFRNEGPFTLIILDIMLPEINGFEVASIIRQEDKVTQILMLTARAAEKDVIQGLERGADDYMTKPFSFKELLLRIRRMADRSDLFSPGQKPANSKLSWGDITWDMDSLELNSSQGHHVLTVLEAKVLNEFVLNPETILTRKHLLSKVWGVNGNVETRTVDNFVMRLRKYIERNPSKPEYLKSVRGRGYKFCGDVNPEIGV
ncbi:response regulator transcription factor [Pseudobacteriovorax antillogorgiicola]|uniref:Two component transcriptional regulator, winged helix family n=1 Tax=Pseudobacteriovorax antillogorgiicola TaxID=1513793 RepID=A0A1Y6CJJ3_9BACT|nr:response regulator transcription factor [Pseudobacteriovorax antillogorgiicola]TCS46728.1 winged helix family two component transcriptional regulator [Pseudobacteriovorax antillogorgiicola]SMF67172.1 two component transcriptional regulator, winged helix family [Pseudobacteriovorax antillogorgiicola]